MKEATDLLILAAGRLPQGRYGGSLAGLGAVSLGRTAVEGLLARQDLPRPGSLVWGGHGAETPVLVGGSEAMSDTPHLVPGLRWGFRMGHRQLPDVMPHDGLRCPVTGLLMGETIERCRPDAASAGSTPTPGRPKATGGPAERASGRSS